MGIRKCALVLLCASVMLLAGCRKPEGWDDFERVIAQIGDPSVLQTSDGRMSFSMESLEEGTAVYFDCDAAFWVKDGVVYVVNDVAEEIAPKLGQAPEHITYDAVVEACMPGESECIWIDTLGRGEELSPAEVVRLEARLKEDATHMNARALLMGYYSARKDEDENAQRECEKHVLWVIRNQPAHPLAGLPWCELDPDLNPKAYPLAAKAWKEHVAANGTSVSILANAAEFSQFHDEALSERCLLKCAELRPGELEWAERLGALYSFHASDSTLGSPAERGQKALVQYEKVLAGTSIADDARLVLEEVAKAAFLAGDYPKAEDYARRLLKDAGPKENWNYGNAIHHSNIVLGSVALQRDDIEKAKAHLIAAGRTPGSPQLDTFGPDMDLAKRLLKRGEREAVLEYFGACAEFWEMGQEKLKRWTAEVEAERQPDFSFF